MSVYILIYSPQGASAAAGRADQRTDQSTRGGRHAEAENEIFTGALK